MNACACMGPQFGEPHCECTMTQLGLERSAAYKEYHSPENTEIRRKEMNKVFAKVYGWNIDESWVPAKDQTITFDKPPEADKIFSLGKDYKND